jgi:serine/threonine-protein phosphatase Stp1
MGGHENGQWASGVIARRLETLAPDRDIVAAAEAVADAIHEANAEILDASRAQGATMGSTAAVMVVREGRFATLWAGDSRVYVLRRGDIHQLTEDHTMVREMVRRGLLTEEEARGHPLSHVVSRAVGVSPRLDLDVIVDDVANDDVFLICSDGLTAVVSEAEIARALQESAPDAACAALVELCLSRGAPDNVTVVAVRCAETTLVPGSRPAASASP